MMSEPAQEISVFDALTRLREIPEDVEEVELGHGFTLHVDRDEDLVGAHSWAMRSDSEVTARGATIPASPTRPAVYPEGVPFLPDIPCTIIVTNGMTHVSWREMACPNPTEDQKERLESAMSPELREFMETSKEHAQQRRQQVLDGLPRDRDHERAQRARMNELQEGGHLKAFLEQMSTEPPPEWVASYEALHRESIEAGWTPDEDFSPPFSARSNRYLRDGLQRTISVMAVMGIPQMSLYEGVPRDEGDGPSA